MTNPSQNIIDQIYSSALKIRITEEEIAKIYHLQEMRSPPHLYIGQEAIASGTCACLNTDDALYSYYRSHGWYLSKGGNLDRMIGELFGKTTGCSKGYGGSMHLIDLGVGFTGTSAIVAGAIPHAVGAAFSFKYKKTKRVALTCFGDAATEEGLFQESLMFAALRKLPVIFVCENNGLATNAWIHERQPPVPIWKRAESCGVPSFHIDGNNAFEVYETVKAAVARAREGNGPTFIEAETCRWLSHCGVTTDFHLGHRSEKDVEPWKKRDPVAFLEKHVSKGLSEKLRKQYVVDFEAAVAAARAAPFPDKMIPEGVTCL